jgi:hypothetical protein
VPTVLITNVLIAAPRRIHTVHLWKQRWRMCAGHQE